MAVAWLRFADQQRYGEKQHSATVSKVMEKYSATLSTVTEKHSATVSKVIELLISRLNRILLRSER